MRRGEASSWTTHPGPETLSHAHPKRQVPAHAPKPPGQRDRNALKVTKQVSTDQHGPPVLSPPARYRPATEFAREMDVTGLETPRFDPPPPPPNDNEECPPDEEEWVVKMREQVRVTCFARVLHHHPYAPQQSLLNCPSIVTNLHALDCILPCNCWVTSAGNVALLARIHGLDCATVLLHARLMPPTPPDSLPHRARHPNSKPPKSSSTHDRGCLGLAQSTSTS